MAVLGQLLQQRHAYYKALLAVEVIALAGLRGLQEAPRLVSLVYLVIGGVGVLLDSPLLPKHRLKPAHTDLRLHRQTRHLEKVFRRRRSLLNAWFVALAMELVWQAALMLNPALAIQLSAIHLVIWLCLMLQVLWGLMNALAEEPLFSGALVMGAAAGYLLVGFTGGLVLNSLLVLDPAAFQLVPSRYQLPVGIAHAPDMLGASFAILTTLGSPLLRAGSLTTLSASVAITIVGQLYIAILIAGVLGKPRQAASIRRAAHLKRRPPAAPRHRRQRP